MDRGIAVYSFDGEFLQYIDEKRFRRLAQCGRISRTIRSRTGKVKRAVLHRLPGEPKPTFAQDYLGTKYSFRQRLDDGLQCYRLRSLGDNKNADEHNLAPDEVRPIFLRVVLECLTPAQAVR